ncbi:Packaged DNA stabilization protein gp26 [Escherichia coli]|uniref:phage tail protein n=1 Tax=Escherichia coli TaxID=562 RepID=UPI000DA520E3|nr:phage tail protein [Escherichia coli]SQJ71957.1 Packaged DNA stabilization protein gp26 [Escherichia coli]
MADSNLNVPVIIQATRLDTSVLPRNIFSQSYLLYVIAQGTDVGNVANKANEAGQGAYDAQVRNDEQDVILVDHEIRLASAEAKIQDHETRITNAESAISNQMSNYNNLANVGLGALQGQANAGQTYANNMSSIAQQSAALAAANANKPSGLQTAISGGASGAMTGAALGSIVPGLGTGLGAAIGGGLGLLGSLF